MPKITQHISDRAKMRPRLDNNAGSLHRTASAGLTTKPHAQERLRSKQCGCALALGYNEKGTGFSWKCLQGGLPV